MAAEALPVGEVINIGSGIGHTVRQTLQTASRFLGKPMPQFTPTRSVFVQRKANLATHL